MNAKQRETGDIEKNKETTKSKKCKSAMDIWKSKD